MYRGGVAAAPPHKKPWGIFQLFSAAIPPTDSFPKKHKYGLRKERATCLLHPLALSLRFWERKSGFGILISWSNLLARGPSLRGLWVCADHAWLQTEHMCNLQFRHLLSTHKRLFLMCSRGVSDMVSLFGNFAQRRGDRCDHRRKFAVTEEQIRCGVHTR